MTAPDISFLDSDDLSFARKHDIRTITRPFMAWDGEGITFSEDEPQHYVLFGNSAGMHVISHDLSTKECLDLLIQSRQEYPNHINVGFGLSYDVNMILKDLPESKLAEIHASGTTRWGRYRLEYRPRKSFTVHKTVAHKFSDFNGQKQNICCKLFDVFGFFQMSFIKACEKSGIELTPYEREILHAGKASRGEFEWEQLQDKILPYMTVELQILIRLMDDLRKNCAEANLRPSRWDGAGALSEALFKRERVKKAMGECPTEVQEAARYGYAGGRFELFKAGYCENAYGYDINSAYPDGIRHLPDLSRGAWRKVETFDKNARFSIWKVDFDNWVSPTFAYPLFYRGSRDEVSYTPRTKGWYWHPDVMNLPTILRDKCVQYGWIFDSDGSTPFAFVPELYDERRALKAAHIGAEKAIKLALNSMYGKMAQRAGYSTSGKIPAFHQLEWAGWVTAWARHKLYGAILQAQSQNALIAVETDAVYSSQPLQLPMSEKLGEWEASNYDFILYWQNGVRWYMEKGEDSIKSAIRGLDNDSVSYDTAYRAIANLGQVPDNNYLRGTTTRFQGMGLALRQGFHRHWLTTERKVIFGGNGKRLHVPDFCSACNSSNPISLHELVVGKDGGESYPHKLPWITDERNVFDDLETMELF